MSILIPAGSAKMSFAPAGRGQGGQCEGYKSYWAQKIIKIKKQKHTCVLTWVAAAMTPTVGSNHHWAPGSWCYLWVMVWDKVATCTLPGFLQEDASLRPWAQQERRCSSSWPRPHLASPPSNPPRSRLTKCHLQGKRWTAQLILCPGVACLIIDL